MKTIKTFFVSAALLISACGDNENENTLKASGNIEVTEVTVSSKVTGEVRAILKKKVNG